MSSTQLPQAAQRLIDAAIAAAPEVGGPVRLVSELDAAIAAYRLSEHVDARDMGEHPVDTILRSYGVLTDDLAKLTDELHAAGYEIVPTARSQTVHNVTVVDQALADQSDHVFGHELPVAVQLVLDAADRYYAAWQSGAPVTRHEHAIRDAVETLRSARSPEPSTGVEVQTIPDDDCDALGFDVGVVSVARTKSEMGHRQILELGCFTPNVFESDPSAHLVTAALKFSNAELGDVRPGDRLSVTVQAYRVER